MRDSGKQEWVSRIIVGLLGGAAVLAALWNIWSAIALFVVLTALAWYELQIAFGIRRVWRFVPLILHVLFVFGLSLLWKRSTTTLAGHTQLPLIDLYIGMAIFIGGLLLMCIIGVIADACLRCPQQRTPISWVWAIGWFWLTTPTILWLVGGMMHRSPFAWWAWWLLITWTTDIFSMVVGKTLGRHRLAPAVSPHKTWEGAIGGFLAALLAGAVLAEVWQCFLGGWQEGLLWAACGSLVAIFGDLFESRLKRWLQIDAMSTILGAHGGILDRIDSWLGIFYLQWIVISFRGVYG